MMLLRLVDRLQDVFDQEVVSLTNSGPVGERIAALGVPVRMLGMRRGVPNPLAVVRLAGMIRRFGPDVVQTWMYHADLVGGLAARLAGMRAVAWNIRNNELGAEESSWWIRQVVTACARLSRHIPARIVCCSHAAMRTHVALGYEPSRFVVLPNGFDLDRFRPDAGARTRVREELGISKRTPLIGLVARFHPQKNHALFFSAAALLHARRPDVHFVLAGRGVDPQNEQMACWIRDAGIEKVAHLLGERDDVPHLTAALDISTSSSSWGEAFPNVLGEAMACCVPCVATDVGDAALIVGDTGRTVPRNNPEALARAWEELLSLPEEERRALGRAARARICEHFDMNAVAERYAALYRELAAAREG